MDARTSRTRAARMALLAAGGLAVAAGVSAAVLRGWWREPPRRPLPDAAVRAALDRPVSVDVHEAPLADVLADLSRQAEVRIEFDRAAALRAAGPGSRAHFQQAFNVSLRGQEIPLEFALELLGQPYDLTCDVRDDRLVVLHRDQAEVTTRTYPIADLLGDGRLAWNEQAVAACVTSLAAPDRWSEVGGEGHIEPAPGALLVAQTEDVHREVETVLALLRDAHSPLPLPEGCPSIGLRGTLADFRSPDAASLRRALAHRVSIDLADAELLPTLDGLAAEHGLKIVMEGWAVHRVQTSQHDRFSLRLRDVPVGYLLDRLLEPHALAWEVAEGAIVVYDVNYTDQGLEPRVYPVRHLLDERLGFDAAAVAEVISTCVEPDAWQEVGGPGSIERVPGGLLVSQTRDVHEGIADLLAQLARMQDPRATTLDEPLDARDRRLEAILAQRVTVHWHNEPAHEALARLLAASGAHNVEVADYTAMRRLLLVVDDQGAVSYSSEQLGMDVAPADAAGRLLTQRLTLQAEERPLRQVLDAALEQLDGDFAWRIDDGEVVQILCDAQRGEWVAVSRCYRVPGLVGPSAIRNRRLVRLIEQWVEPDSWQEVGGPGGIEVVPAGLIVSQHPYIHDEVRALLQALQRLGDADCPLLQELSADDGTDYSSRLYRWTRPAALEDVSGAVLIDGLQTIVGAGKWYSLSQQWLGPLGDQDGWFGRIAFCDGGILVWQSGDVQREMEDLVTALHAGNAESLERLRQAIEEAENERKTGNQ
jgi:hypothetical protein